MALRGCSGAQLHRRAGRSAQRLSSRCAAPLPRACASSAPPPPPPHAAPAKAEPHASRSVLPAAAELPRRAALAALAAVAACSPLAARADAPPASGALTRYVDAKAGFAVGARRACAPRLPARLSVNAARDAAHPASWELVSKPGANALFKDPTASVSTLGVTVRRAAACSQPSRPGADAPLLCAVRCLCPAWSSSAAWTT